MTPHEIRLVRKSFELVRPISGQVAALFYDKLFERDAALAALFPADLTAQGDQWMQTLDAIVRQLDRPADLMPALQALGRRHVGDGVLDASCPIVGAVLIDTLAAAIGVVFTPPVRAAWAALVKDVTNAIRAGAAQADGEREWLAA